MVLTPDQIKSRLQTLGVSADKFLGQHFLINEKVLDVIVQATLSSQTGSEAFQVRDLDLVNSARSPVFPHGMPAGKPGMTEKPAKGGKTTVILEVGPGLGVLTEELVKVAPTIAVERDPVFARYLPSLLRGEGQGEESNLTVIQGNILEVLDTNLDFPFKFQSGLYSPMIEPGAMQPAGDAYTFSQKNWAVVANIPYGITSPLIRKILECPILPRYMVLTVQKEVAERICCLAGDSRRGLLTLMVETMGVAKLMQIVPKTAFWPVPKVDSAVIRIVISPKFNTETREVIIKLAQHAFAGKRKQIVNSLASGLHKTPVEIKKMLEKCHISTTLRAEALTLEDWAMLAKNYQLS